MAFPINYTKTTWVNDQAPAINDTNLNKIEAGIKDAADVCDAQLLADSEIADLKARLNIT